MISADGDRVAFVSDVLFPEYENDLLNAYVFERSTMTFSFVGGNLVGGAPNGGTGYSVSIAAAGEPVRVTSRRGSVVVPVGIDAGLRDGLAFMTFHTPDEVDTNALTIDATDPKSGTAEFKAAAVRIDRLPPHPERPLGPPPDSHPADG